MVTKTFLKNIATELETPRHRRPFGSGWLSGTLGLLAGLAGLGMVIVLRYPALTRMPELAAIDSSALYRAFLYFALIWGFLLAALSLTLRRQKALGTAAMVVTLLATMIGSLPRFSGLPGGRLVLRPFFLLSQRAVPRRPVHPGRAAARQEQGADRIP